MGPITERERLGRHCMVRCPAAAQVDLSGPLYSSIQLGEGMHDPGAGLWPRASGSLPLSFIHPHLISHLSSTLSHPSRNVADCIVCHVVPFLFFFFSFLPFFLPFFFFFLSLLRSPSALFVVVVVRQLLLLLVIMTEMPPSSFQLTSGWSAALQGAMYAMGHSPNPIQLDGLDLYFVQ